MKLNRFLMGIFALTATVGLATADTIVNVTGASAFRKATLQCIKARFDAGNSSGASYLYGEVGTGSYDGTNQVIFKGNFPGLNGQTTVVRTSFSGSVEGIKGLLGLTDPVYDTYINPADLTGTPSSTPTLQTGMSATQTLQGDIAFSDVSIAATPYASQASSFAPASAGCGVVVFTMLKAEGGDAALTNVTNKQFQALFTRGIEKLSLFTGVAADASKYVIACGRNDGSGTRTTYMAETGTGITTLVNQYIGNASGGNVNWLQLVGITGSNRSIVWGQNVPGNGGYSSGSNLRDLFGNSTSAGNGGTGVNVYTDSTAVPGTDEPDFTAPITLVTFLAVSDAYTAIANGAVALSFNGVGINPAVSPLGAADIAKIARGQYTAWGNEQMYRRSTLTTDQQTVDTGIRSNISTFIGAAGITSATMQVTRNSVGGVVLSN